MAWRKYQINSGHTTLDHAQLEPEAVLSRLEDHFSGRIQGGTGVVLPCPLRLSGSGWMACL